MGPLWGLFYAAYKYVFFTLVVNDDRFVSSLLISDAISDWLLSATYYRFNSCFDVAI